MAGVIQGIGLNCQRRHEYGGLANDTSMDVSRKLGGGCTVDKKPYYLGSIFGPPHVSRLPHVCF